MQAYTFTKTELIQLLEDTIQLFSSAPNVYDFSANAPQMTIDDMLARLAPPIPFDGSLPDNDTGNVEHDLAIEPVF
mgnify:CR=1 FL=1